MRAAGPLERRLLLLELVLGILPLTLFGLVLFPVLPVLLPTFVRGLLEAPADVLDIAPLVLGLALWLPGLLALWTAFFARMRGEDLGSKRRWVGLGLCAGLFASLLFAWGDAADLPPALYALVLLPFWIEGRFLLLVCRSRQPLAEAG